MMTKQKKTQMSAEMKFMESHKNTKLLYVSSLKAVLYFLL